MGKGRRLWQRIRGSRDGLGQVVKSATGESGGGTLQSAPVDTTTSEPDPTVQQDEKATAKEMWLAAYKRLADEDGTEKMVKTYETLLSKQLGGQIGQIGGSTVSSLSDPNTAEEKIAGMRRITEVTLETASLHSERKQGFVKAARVMNTISSTVIKPMLQTEAVASLAWAGVCVALEFSIRAVTAGLDMVDGLSHVAKRMEWYMLLHTLLLASTRPSTPSRDFNQAQLRESFRKNTQELYYSLLLYEMQCVCYCYRDSDIIKTLRALVTLDDWKARLNDIKELESRIQLDMTQFAHSQTKHRLEIIAHDADERFNDIEDTLQKILEAKEQTFSVQEARYLQGLVGLFNTSDYNRQMKLNPNRVQGTCEWFCNHDVFKKWLKTDVGLLLVSADPGCGKSTLARYLIEDVLPQQSPGGKVLYFFFKDTKEQKWLNTAICAVLHQLLLDDNPLVSKLQSGITQAGANITEDSSSLWKLFSAACQYLPGGIICVFDALDECDPEKCTDLIRNIQGMLENGTGRRVIRFLVTTRGYPRLLKQFSSYESGLIHLDGDGKHEKDAIQHEISLVLDYKLAHLSRTKNLDNQPERKAAIESALRSKGSEQRTYLWLKLVFIIMERIPWKSDSDWKKVILSPPQSVNDAYATLLQNVPEEEKDYVKILLHLMVATYRPLSLREMKVAIIVRDSPGAHDEESLGLQSDEEFKDWVIQTCGFFVTVYDNELYFIHQTAKEFLLGSGPGTSCPPVLDWFSPVTDQVANKIMAESSIAYLSLICFHSAQFQDRAWKYYHSANTETTERDCSEYEKSLRKDYGFLDYTARFLGEHFRQCQSVDGTNFSDIDDDFIPYYISLFTAGGCHAPGWILLHMKYYPKDDAFEVNLADNYDICDAALWIDHCRLLVYSLHHHACDRTLLLHTAVEQSASDCVRYIAATGLGLNAQDACGATALSSAAYHRDADLVEILLDYGADVNRGAGLGDLPLSYIISPRGARSKWMGLVRRMVCQGADLKKIHVEFEHTAGMTPLACVSAIPDDTSGYDENIQRLDDWIHWKISASGLSIAADLLQHLDIFSADPFVAAYKQSLIRLFLDHGAEIDGTFPNDLPMGRKHSGPKTPLGMACLYALRENHNHAFWNAVFLLHSGANSRLGIGSGHSALDWLIRARRDLKPESAENRKLDTRGSWGRWNVLAALLLKHNPPSSYINKPISYKTMKTRLHSLVESHFGTYDLEAIKLLLDNGAEVDCQDLYGKTPVHYVVLHNFGELESGSAMELLKMLIEKGAELNLRDSLGRTPMHYIRSPYLLNTLVGNGADVEARDYQSNTPLQSILACSGAEFSPDIIQSLIAFGADTKVTNWVGETLLHTAAASGFTESLPHLLRAGIDVNVTTNGGQIPLQSALNNRYHKAAALLLRRGAGAKHLLQRSFDTEQRDRDSGATLLAFVSACHAHDHVATLLRRGANPNALPTVGAADLEMYLGRADCMQIKDRWVSKAERLEGRAWKTAGSERRLRYDCGDYGDDRPLHLAMHNSWTHDAESTVEVLLKHGADIEARSSLGQTPLQVACHRGNEDGARFLLEKGAHVDHMAWDGDTALDFACAAWQPNVGLIRALLTHVTTSDSGYHGGPDLGRIAGRWLNEAHGARDPRKSSTEDASTLCCRTAKSDAINHDDTGLQNLVVCRCQECCREHERRACAVVQILLDAGAWIQLRYYQRNMDFPFETARERGWTNLGILLEKAAVPSCRRAWLPPKTRRRSLSATRPAQR